MKKILILYATVEGQTAKIAAKLSEHLAAAGARVSLVNVEDSKAANALDLAGFDRLVFGASIHVGKIEKSLAGFINAHAAAITAKPRSLFIVLMAAATKDTTRRDASLAQVRKTVSGQLQVPFDEPEMIAGALKYTQYNWFIKWVMKGIAKKEGGSTDTSRDFEYTDWEQVAAYARRLAG